MALWTRIANAFRGERLTREIAEELESHVEEGVAQGRDLAEARRALGPALRHTETSRDVRVAVWLDSLRADAVFGWRQLAKRKATSAAAILSLGLAMGACTAAFRLIDAILLRPLPVAEPGRLYGVFRQARDRDGKTGTSDVWAYPAFRRMREAVRDQAELLSIGYAERRDITWRFDAEIEKAEVQYVSGWMFSTFGLRPELGRLFSENDDLRPDGHPYAVISHDYWTRRLGQEPNAVGRTFHIGERIFEIAGVAEPTFAGTEPGTVTDIFLPSMMEPRVLRDDWKWTRIMARLKPGSVPELLRARLHAVSRSFEEDRAKEFTGMSRQDIERFLDQTVVLAPAAGGLSDIQHDYRVALVTLGILVAVVLLIACANVANLMTAVAATRRREMALRVSIGAGRRRLVQLVLAESAWIGLLAAAAGLGFAWWAAPFVVSRLNPPDNPVRLALPADWRVLVFGLALPMAVTLLFGLAPALRASAIRPADALRAGAASGSQRRLMRALVAVQAAFCIMVLFVGGLFATTLDRLSHRPIGFSAPGLVTLDAVAQRPQPSIFWEQVVDRLRTVPGVETTALAEWRLLGGGSWNGFVSVNGAPPGVELGYFLRISPGWMAAMKIPLVRGRDFRDTDTTPGSAIVSEAFARQFLGGENPIGKRFSKGSLAFQVVGVARDVPYRDIHEPNLPVAYIPFRSVDERGSQVPFGRATIIVRTTGSPGAALLSSLRREVPRARPGFYVSDVHTMEDLVQAQTIRERLLAMLALFFSAVALLLAGAGLYGVLDYSVLQRRREIGIRMAIGAQAAAIARLVTGDVMAMVAAGAGAGLTLGLASVRYIASLLYQVKGTDTLALAIPAAALVSVSLVAALPAVMRAAKVDPAAMLRAE
ncbi:MAG: ABC transporter permease [Acidobacteriota bacterium]|nr:ABC transporter permease [Acidobacteriota bacterium]